MTARSVLVAVVAMGIMGLAGCATKETATLNVQAVPSASGAFVPKEGASVVVAPFEDSRPEKNRVGVRRHLWGGETTFTVPGGKPGDAVARTMADYLKQKGWRADMVKGDASSGAQDVLIAGKVLNFSVDATSKVFQTEINVKTKVVVEATNKADGSIVRMTLNGEGTQKVFWFDPDDAQDLASEVLTESFEKLVQSTKWEDKSGTKLLRVK